MWSKNEANLAMLFFSTNKEISKVVFTKTKNEPRYREREKLALPLRWTLRKWIFEKGLESLKVLLFSENCTIWFVFVKTPFWTKFPWTF